MYLQTTLHCKTPCKQNYFQIEASSLRLSPLCVLIWPAVNLNFPLILFCRACKYKLDWQIMASGRSARLPPTPQQPQQPVVSSTSLLSTINPAALRHDVSPNNNHPAALSSTVTEYSIQQHNHQQLQQQQQQQQYQQQFNQQNHHHQLPTSNQNQNLILDNNNSSNNPFASQVLDSLSDRERRLIINVLKRDEGMRQRDAARIMWVSSKFGLLLFPCPWLLFKYHFKAQRLSGRADREKGWPRHCASIHCRQIEIRRRRE